jgi:hypothetical protein
VTRPEHRFLVTFSLDGSEKMKDFEQVWASIAETRHAAGISPHLKTLVLRVHIDATTIPVGLPTLRGSLSELLRYLSSEGRTNANCWTTDLFFSTDELEEDWSSHELPEDLHEVFCRMSEALHDTVSSPDVAWNFGCLPEQLLELLAKSVISE